MSTKTKTTASLMFNVLQGRDAGQPKDLPSEAGPGFGTDLPAPADPLKPMLRSDLRLHQLRTYDHNPRRQRNPRYDEIKDSIRAQGGLTTPITVTRRPGYDWYMVESGGNTRLQILQELYAETGDERFNSVPVVFRPWESESHVLTRHLIENELRGDMVLIDKALALAALKEQIEATAEGPISRNEYLKRVAALGYTVSKRTVIVLEYAATVLYPLIPTALQAGLGRSPIERLRKLETVIRAYWQQKVPPEHADAFDELWPEYLRRHDAEVLQIDRFQREFEGVLAETAGMSLQFARLEIDEAMRTGKDADIDDAPEARADTAPAALPAPAVPETAELPEPTPEPAAAPPAAPPVDHIPAPVRTAAPAPVRQIIEPDAADAGDEEAHDDEAQPAALPGRSLVHSPAATSHADADPAAVLVDLRTEVASHAFNLARMFRLDCYLKFPEPDTACGYGYLVDLPIRPMTAGKDADNNILRCGIWWLLASLSGQHDFPERLEAIAGEPMRIAPMLIEQPSALGDHVELYDSPAFFAHVLGSIQIDDEPWEELMALVRAVRAITRWLMVNEQMQAVLWGAEA